MIRSSRHILKFSTDTKLCILERMFQDTRECVEFYIDLILKQELPLANNLSSKVLPEFKNIKHSRYKQLLYKHASEIVRSQIASAEGRRYRRYKFLYKKCKDNNKLKFFTNKKFKDLKLKNILKSKYFTKPVLDNFALNLDERFINFNTESKHFDEFLCLTLPYFKQNKRIAETVNLPIKQHKHSLKYSKDKNWTRKNTIRLLKINNNFYIEFMYEKQDPEKRTEGSALGIDIGYKKLITCSDSIVLGDSLEQIYTKLANKKRGSKNYKQLLLHKKHEINRFCNLLDLSTTKQLVIEDLKLVKHKSKFSSKFNNKLQYWSYLQVINKFENLCEENGVLLTKVPPAYTSQTCSCCKNIDKLARKGEIYKCSKCNLILDADINAAINILHRGIYSSSTTKSVNST